MQVRFSDRFQERYGVTRRICTRDARNVEVGSEKTKKYGRENREVRVDEAVKYGWVKP
jgi:hypothetical protein